MLFVPVHAPDQVVNVELALGAAVNVIGVVVLNDALHVLPQLMPDGEDVTEPAPLPVRCTVTVRVLGPESVLSLLLQADNSTRAMAIE